MPSSADTFTATAAAPAAPLSAPQLLAWLRRVHLRVQSDPSLPGSARDAIAWEIGKACALLHANGAPTGFEAEAGRLLLAPAGESATGSAADNLAGELRQLETAWMLFLRQAAAA